MVCDVCKREIIGRRYTGAGRDGDYTLCKKHYDQLKKYGRFLDNNPRTIQDPNEIHVAGSTTFIDLYNENCECVAQAMIDTDCLNLVKDYKWRLSPSGYAVASGPNKTTVHMHRIILNSNTPVDHINHNKLDNHRFNLRNVTKSENQMNSNNKGVYFDKKTNTYKPSIKVHQKMIMFKGFAIESHALLCRWYAEAILFREFRYIKPKPVVETAVDKEIFSYTYDRLLKFMPVLFVTSSGIRCFVDDSWIPFFIDTAGVVNRVNPNDGQFYYNNVAMQPAMYDCESGDIML